MRSLQTPRKNDPSGEGQEGGLVPWSRLFYFCANCLPRPRAVFRSIRRLGLAGVLALAAATPGSILYDNSSNYLSSMHAVTGEEFGDEIWLKGQDPIVTEFQFQYYVNPGAGLSGNERAEVFFRANDGPGGTGSAAPGTLLYTSPQFDLFNGYRTVTISGLALGLPRHFTWTVLFTGLRSDESAGLLFYNPVTVGSATADFWQENPDGTWETQVLPGAQADFAARVEGTSINLPPPAMGIQLLAASGQIRLSWGAAYSGYFLQEGESLAGPWHTILVNPVAAGRDLTTDLPLASGNRFYRIYLPGP